MLENVKNFIRRILRFGLRGPVTNLLGVYFSRFIPKKWMESLSEKRHKAIEDKIYEIVNIRSCVPSATPMRSSNIIWFCWLQGKDNMPPIIDLCYRSLLKHHGIGEIVFLSEENLYQILDIPEALVAKYKSGHITRTHFSDIIRMTALSQHGGLWMDATVFLTEDIPDYVFSMPLFTIKDGPKGGNVSRRRWTGFCMAAHKGCPLPRTVLNIFREYWSRETLLIDYFFIDYCIDLAYRNSEECKRLLDAVPLNNPNLHCLTPLLCNDFDELKFSELCRNTFMFKLSYKAFPEEQLHANPNSYYAHLRELAGS